MASLLIAGYGFLGKALEECFARAGWSVAKLSRSGSGGAIRCDLSSAGDVGSLTGEYDLIIHCAASGGGGEESYRRVYLQGARNLVARFPGTAMIFTSSTSVYPQTDHDRVTETSPADPLAPTARVLREAEQVVLSAGGVVARLSGLYGQGRCHVLNHLLSGTAQLDGDGARIMNFIHRDDVAAALLTLASQQPFLAGEIFNVSALPVSQYDCYKQLSEYFGVAMPQSSAVLMPRKRGNSSKRVSSAKLRALGWQPRYDDFLSMALHCRPE